VDFVSYQKNNDAPRYIPMFELGEEVTRLPPQRSR
jgi:hypothetical protein